MLAAGGRFERRGRPRTVADLAEHDGLGFAQVLLAGRQPDLEQAEIGLRLAPLPVWLILHEEVCGNARIRRVADCLTDALGARLRGG